MRSAGNFSPEWGYLAPAPSFARTARIVFVATAIGATAGAGVVLSLVDRSTGPEPVPVAARAIVTGVQAAAVPAAPQIGAAPPAPVAPPSPAAPAASPPVGAPTAASVASAQPPNHSQTPTSHPPDRPAAVSPTEANVSAQAPAPVAPPENATPANAEPANAGSIPAAGVAALSEPSTTGAAADVPDGGTVAQEAPAPQKKVKHHAYYDRAPFRGLGTFFHRLFVAHAGRSNY
jgi:hypothetical protein